MSEAEEYFKNLHSQSMNIKRRFDKVKGGNFPKRKNIKIDFKLSKDEYKILRQS